MAQWGHHSSATLLLVLLSLPLLLVLLSSTLLLELLVLLLLPKLLLVLFMDGPAEATIIPTRWTTPVTAPLVKVCTLCWCDAQVLLLCLR